MFYALRTRETFTAVRKGQSGKMKAESGQLRLGRAEAGRGEAGIAEAEMAGRSAGRRWENTCWDNCTLNLYYGK